MDIPGLIRVVFVTNIWPRRKEAEINNKSSTSKDNFAQRKLQNQITKISVDNQLHKIQAQEFYMRKRRVKEANRKNITTEAICLDFTKNFPTLNVSNSDVYYKR